MKARTNQRWGLLALLAVILVGGVHAEDGPDFSIEGVRIFGGDIGLAWGGLKLVAGGGWQSLLIGRDLKTGEPVAYADATKAYVLNAGLALRQTWKLEEASVWTGIGAIVHGDAGLNPGNGALADEKGGLFTSLQAGISRDKRERNDHRVLSGHYVEAFVEFGPAALSVRSTDYWKLSASSALFIPLWDLGGDQQLFSGVWALRANSQWIRGSSVPLLRLESTEIRGYYSLYDTQLRSVATTELRLGLPSLLGRADLIPTFFAFAEGGRVYGYNNASLASGRSAWLASAGAGLGLNLFGITTPNVVVALPLTEESGLWWTINFDLSF